MHSPSNTHPVAAAADDEIAYRERLSPSLWALLSAAVAAPMVGLVFVPLDATIALIAGLVVAASLICVLVWAAPVIEVRAGQLRVGRAHIPVSMLGDPVGHSGDRARQIRGPELPATAWHLLRGGIDPVVRVAVIDDRDPVTEWVFSTRTPDRVVAMIQRAQRASAQAEHSMQTGPIEVS